MLSQILVQDFLQQHHQECFGQIWTKMRVAEEEEEEEEGEEEEEEEAEAEAEAEEEGQKYMWTRKRL